MNTHPGDKATAGNITDDKYHAFRDCLEELSGIILSKSKKGLIINRLTELMSQYNHGSIDELIDKMKSDALLRESLMDKLTVNETSWFRDSFPFDIFREKLLPEFSRAQPLKVRVWSAACSTGEEAYSLSMAADEYNQASPGSLPTSAVRILGTDISPTAIQKAQGGCYEDAVLSRGLTEEKKQRYFNKVESGWNVIDAIKDRVSFKVLNLKEDYKELGQFDIIFCRNVLTYFSTALKADIVSRMADALKPGGYLVLGRSESITNYFKHFEIIQWRDGVVYKRKL